MNARLGNTWIPLPRNVKHCLARVKQTSSSVRMGPASLLTGGAITTMIAETTLMSKIALTRRVNQINSDAIMAVVFPPLGGVIMIMIAMITRTREIARMLHVGQTISLVLTDVVFRGHGCVTLKMTAVITLMKEAALQLLLPRPRLLIVQGFSLLVIMAAAFAVNGTVMGTTIVEIEAMNHMIADLQEIVHPHSLSVVAGNAFQHRGTVMVIMTAVTTLTKGAAHIRLDPLPPPHLGLGEQAVDPMNTPATMVTVFTLGMCVMERTIVATIQMSSIAEQQLLQA